MGLKVSGVELDIDDRDPHASVRAATTANITLSGTQTIDGVSVAVDDRVLVKNQDTASENGIYDCAAGAWSRSSDSDVSEEVTSGFSTYIEEGTANAKTHWMNNRQSNYAWYHVSDFRAHH